MNTDALRHWNIGGIFERFNVCPMADPALNVSVSIRGCNFLLVHTGFDMRGKHDMSRTRHCIWAVPWNWCGITICHPFCGATRQQRWPVADPGKIAARGIDFVCPPVTPALVPTHDPGLCPVTCGAEDRDAGMDRTSKGVTRIAWRRVATRFALSEFFFLSMQSVALLPVRLIRVKNILSCSSNRIAPPRTSRRCHPDGLSHISLTELGWQRVDD